MMEQLGANVLCRLLGFLVKGFGVKFGLECGLFLQGHLILVGDLKELFVNELRRELLE